MTGTASSVPGEKRPDLLLLGATPEVAAVKKELDGLRVCTRQLTGAEALNGEPATDFLGAVLVAPGRRPLLIRQLRWLRDRFPGPVFVILSDDSSQRLVRRIYSRGAAGVFEWPRERKQLARYLAEMLSLRIVRGPARKADTALARVVRSHLKVLLSLPRIPRVEASGGMVRLTGSVDSLHIQREIERGVERVPGVRGLDTSGLVVVPDPAPNAQIRRALRRVLAGNRSVDQHTIAYSVEGGHVIVTGTAEDKAELARIRDLATRLRGVRGIELRVLVGSEAKRHDRGAARRLQAVVDDLLPDEAVQVTFYRGVAVLTGEVSTLRAKRDAASFVEEQEAVNRVVNKLDVDMGVARR